MTTITQSDIGDITGMDDNTSWTFYVPQMRESDSGTGIVTPKRDRKYPVAGVLTVELDPGPAVVLAPDGKTYPFTVPDTASDLWSLIQAAVTIPPTTIHQQLLDAVDAWLDSHTNAWDVLPGRPAPLVAGANVANGYAGLDGAGKIGTAQLPAGVLTNKGATDCSANPNYPAASKGDAYVVTVAGKIGGASGKSVDVGDVYFATADNAGGTQASVGASWAVLEHNLVGALLSANNLSDIASPSTALSNLGGQPIDSDLTTLASLTATTDSFIQSKAGAWSARTIAQVKTDLSLSGTNTGDQTSVTGNAGTATTLATSRNIDGQAFNGSADITVIAPGTHAATSKTTPVDADEFPAADSASSFTLKKVTFANLKAWFKAYYDSVATTLTNKTLTDPKVNHINDTNGNRVFDMPAAASAVNYFEFDNTAAGITPTIYAWGADTDIDLNLDTKGAGVVKAKSVPVVTTTGTQTLTNKTLTNPTITNYTESVVAIGSSSTAKTIALTSGTVQTCTLTGNCTFTMPTAVAGKSFTLLLNTGAGSFTAAFTSVKWPANTAPTITTTAARLDVLTFTSDGVNWYGSFAQNYTP